MEDMDTPGKTVSSQPVSEKTMNVAATPEAAAAAADFKEVKKTFDIRNSVPSSHFTQVRTIGLGGVGLVISAHDPNLDRDVAVKMLRGESKNKLPDIERFIREGRATANIEHPNVIPVHEMGVMDEVGVYFTMKKVKGDDFHTVIENLKKGDKAYCGKYTRMYLLEIFINICNGVSFAHNKRIIHRDLKPHNILLGDYGEVLVMDWGLAKYLDSKEDDKYRDLQAKRHFHADSSLTTDGTISGTPNYMPPEQADGKILELDERSDIYSLGAILYQILTYSPPFSDEDVYKVLADVMTGNFIRPRKRCPELKIPCELEAVCLKAMSLEKSKRYQTVQDLIKDIRNYIEGFSVSAHPDSPLVKFRKLCMRHPVLSSTTGAAVFIVVTGFLLLKLILFIQFQTIIAAADENRIAGNSELRNATQAYREYDSIASKRVVREESAKEEELSRKLNAFYINAENRYETAVVLYNSVPKAYRRSVPAKEGLMEIMVNRLRYSILVQNYERAEKWISLIRMWTGPDFDKLSQENKNTLLGFVDIIRGDGRMSVSTKPSGASVTLWKLVDRGDGILSESEPRELGSSPVNEFMIPKGSYLLKIKSGKRLEVLYPLAINHGEKENPDIYIPESVPAGMVYIPAGRFFIGGENSRYYRSHEFYLSGFFIRKYEVTFGEYLEFWKGLKTGAEKEKHMSKIILDVSGRVFTDAWDGEGKLVKPLSGNLPVVGILHESALAYCDWLSGKSGKKFMLPTAEQWEKAARGVDGRSFPWGDGFNAGFANIHENAEARRKFGYIAPPGSFPKDISVYGLYDAGGNAREMTSSRFLDGGDFFQLKGASASTTRRFLYCAYSSDTPVAPSDVGFRYVTPLDEK
ncbi:MAG: bifunctional serine/threonine-protein kinase/formylglycine-generating enzyme family protein [Victivallales bacterium]|jgi:serine/threonine-protein kinase